MEEVAALPLLRPFKLKKDSPLLSVIVNEQHASQHLAALLRTGKQLNKELAKGQLGREFFWRVPAIFSPPRPAHEIASTRVPGFSSFGAKIFKLIY